MDEISRLKKELKEAQQGKEIAKLKAEIKETKTPSKVKAGIKKAGDFFRPRGNEKQKLADLMNM